MSFRFRLDTVLLAKKEKEQFAVKAVSAVQLEIRDIEAKIKKLQGEQCDLEKRMLGPGLDARNLASHHSYLQKLSRELAEQQDEWMRAQNTLQKKRKLLTEAMQERKSLEKLKEKRREEWESRLKKAEANALDDIASMQHARKGMDP